MRSVRRHIDNETGSEPTVLYPACPAYLKGEGATLWPSVVRKLVQEGDWDPHDSELVAATYCTYAAILSAAIAEISEHGAVTAAAITGVPMHSPWRKVLHESAEAVLKYGALLNLTPDTRWIRDNHRAERV